MNNWDFIRDLLAEFYVEEKDRIREDTKLDDDLDADYWDLAEILIAIENEFQVEFDDTAADRIHTAGDLLKELNLALTGEDRSDE